jgi:hypothetical protein
MFVLLKADARGTRVSAYSERERECVRTHEFALAAAEGATMGGWKRKTSTGDVRSWNKFAGTKYSRQGRVLSAQIYAKTLPKFKWGFFGHGLETRWVILILGSLIFRLKLQDKLSLNLIRH